MGESNKKQKREDATVVVVGDSDPTVHRRISFGKKKLLLIAAVVLIAVVVGGLLYNFMKDKKDSSETRATIDVKVSQEDVEYGQRTVVVVGSVVAVTSDSMTVKTKDGPVVAMKLVTATIYQKGENYLQASKADISASKEVTVVYNNVSNEAITVWYLR